MRSLFTAPQVVSASLLKLYSSLSSTDLRNAVLVVESHSPQPLKNGVRIYLWPYSLHFSLRTNYAYTVTAASLGILLQMYCIVVSSFNYGPVKWKPVP